MPPAIQLPSIVIAASCLPNASPPHPVDGVVWVLNFRTPSFISFWTSWRPWRLPASVADIAPEELTTQPPAWRMKAPDRLMSLPMTRPVTVPEVSFLATASRSLMRR